jgi:hypothetical protein
VQLRVLELPPEQPARASLAQQEQAPLPWQWARPYCG